MIIELFFVLTYITELIFQFKKARWFGKIIDYAKIFVATILLKENEKAYYINYFNASNSVKNGLILKILCSTESL